MPCCAAVNCSNSAKKGFLMKRFPKDPARRKEWHVKTGRGQWKPTDFSCLCEVHFAPEMWEKTREDGSRKLKANAVPTIFSFSLPKSKINPLVQRKLLPAKKTKPSFFHQATSDEQITTDNTVVTIDGNLGAHPSKSSKDLSESQQLSISNSKLSKDAISLLEHAISPLSHEVENSAKLKARLNKIGKMYFKEKNKVRKYKILLRNTRKKLKNVAKKAKFKI